MNLLKGMETIFDSFLKLLKLITCLVLVFITLSVCVEVVLRYFFNKPQVWVIELSEYGLLYLTFLAAAWVLKAEAHIAVDLVTDRLSQTGRSFLSIIHCILIFGVSTVLIWYGARVTWSYFSQGTYNPTILEVPTAAILVVIPFGGVFLFVQSLRGIISSVLKYKRLRPGVDKGNASRGREG
jgi:TRAP-type C4-dicarboxylate transport system permease small subunit